MPLRVDDMLTEHQSLLGEHNTLADRITQRQRRAKALSEGHRSGIGNLQMVAGAGDRIGLKHEFIYNAEIDNPVLAIKSGHSRMAEPNDLTAKVACHMLDDCRYVILIQVARAVSRAVKIARLAIV